MVLVYEVDLYYEVDVLKKVVIGDTIKYLVSIEHNKFVYEETKNAQTGLISYSFGPEIYLPNGFAVDLDEYPNLSMIVSLYEALRFSELNKVKISGIDKSKTPPVQTQSVKSEPMRQQPRPNKTITGGFTKVKPMPTTIKPLKKVTTERKSVLDDDFFKLKEDMPDSEPQTRGNLQSNNKDDGQEQKNKKKSNLWSDDEFPW